MLMDHSSTHSLLIHSLIRSFSHSFSRTGLQQIADNCDGAWGLAFPLSQRTRTPTHRDEQVVALVLEVGPGRVDV